MIMKNTIFRCKISVANTFPHFHTPSKVHILRMYDPWHLEDGPASPPRRRPPGIWDGLFLRNPVFSFDDVTYVGGVAVNSIDLY